MPTRQSAPALVISPALRRGPGEPAPRRRHAAQVGAERVLARFTAERGAAWRRDPELAEATIQLAEHLFTLASASERGTDQRASRRLARMIRDPRGQTFTRLLTDRAARLERSRITEQAGWLVRCLGVPRFLSPPERAALRLAASLGPLAPGLIGGAIRGVIHATSRAYVAPAEPDALGRVLASLRAEGVRVNINPIGEDVVDEGEAERRVEQYSTLLSASDADAVSVKVSSILAITDPAAFDATLARLRPRIVRICQAALDAPPGPHGDRILMLDMEAYRDFRLTLGVFESVLADPALDRVRIGIALQAYLPDSHGALERLLALARARAARGGRATRLRIVKGANLALERLESQLHGQALPLYGSKREVDASFKRLVERACDPELSGAVQVGIASHNPFDLAWGLMCRTATRDEADVGFELLAGMNEPLRRAVQSLGGDVLVYLPIVEERALASAVAYLTRRLDEVTAPDNYLRRSPEIIPGGAAWREQAARARRAVLDRAQVPTTPFRPTDRFEPLVPPPAEGHFINEPETDFSAAGSRQELERVISAWRAHGVAASESALAQGGTLPLVIAGAPRFTHAQAPGRDPSLPGTTPYRVSLAGAQEIEAALVAAARAHRAWQARSDRPALLRAVAQRLRERRAELIAAMILDGGKRRLEADIEVCEAIDYAEYYARSYEALSGRADLQLSSRGPVLVAPPWNFPLAIPLGGALAALVTGCPVLLKPPPETPLVGLLAACACWDAGVPKDVLQLVFAPDAVASRLVEDPRVAAVVLTGATTTARRMLRLRPGLTLFAETGGKNPFIVTGSCDRELAVRDIVTSAFGHAGQKCSATSVLICTDGLYEDRGFRALLRDAAASLRVGPAWEADSFVTPLIRPPRAALARALGGLEPGEEWLLEPRPMDASQQLYSPGIKLGVEPGGFTHQTELFGPVLAVMRAESLVEAVKLANSTQYGLTAGLHSLDEREQAYFARHVAAGNRYVNRTTTGAIVGRQSFGGWKASSFGPGAKAGGPGYVLELSLARDIEQEGPTLEPNGVVRHYLGQVQARLTSDELRELKLAAGRYAAAQEELFAEPGDLASIPGQDNLLAYAPVEPLLLRVGAGAGGLDIARALVAMLTSGATPEISVDPVARDSVSLFSPVGVRALRVETEAELAVRATALRFGRVRLVGEMSATLAGQLALQPTHVVREPVTSNGLLELRASLREVTLSIDHHRYGLPGRATPELRPRVS